MRNKQDGEEILAVKLNFRFEDWVQVREGGRFIHEIPSKCLFNVIALFFHSEKILSYIYVQFYPLTTARHSPRTVDPTNVDRGNEWWTKCFSSTLKFVKHEHFN